MDHNKPISELEENIQKEYIQIANILYSQLEINKLEVVLIPAPEQKFIGHKIRVAINHPPEWFSEIYNKYKNGISRKESLKALYRIKENKDKNYVYDQMYREYIHELIINGDRNNQIIPANNIKINYLDFNKNHNLNEYEKNENNLEINKEKNKIEYDEFKEFEGEVPF